MATKLGLFDDAAAMVKFQEWHTEHEANITRRNDDHKNKQRAKKVYVPIVKKVKEEVAVEATTEATPEEGTAEA